MEELPEIRPLAGKLLAPELVKEAGGIEITDCLHGKSSRAVLDSSSGFSILSRALAITAPCYAPA